MITLAAAAWPVEWHATPAAFEAKLAAWIAEAAAGGAGLVLLPEYAGMEVAFAGPRTALSTPAWCHRAADLAAGYVARCADLAQRYGLWLMAGSLPMRRPGGALVNRAMLLGPQGQTAWQDKQILTPWERRETPLVPGQGLTCWQMPWGRLGALVCYDSEFPLLAQAQQADVLLIPSCTEDLSGQSRVQIAARARALEGQAVCLHAPLLGGVPECELIDRTCGQAGLYAPPDDGFPPDGVLAQGGPDRPGWTLAEIDPDRLISRRGTGQVALRAHWPESVARSDPATVRPVARFAP